MENEMAKIKLDTSNPGKASGVLARASILFARVSGYIAENKIRESLGEALAYDSDSFEEAIAECFPETLSQRGEDNGNTDRRCATCKHWPGTDEAGFANCQHPLPEWADDLLDADNPQMPDMRGTSGKTCPCWAERTAEENTS
jgi:hypothetical protein